MTTRCIKCHRPLKNATETGMGPVCAKTARPVQSHERDLFGYDLDKAEAAARYRSDVGIAASVVEGLIAVRDLARAARVRCGVWAA